MYVLGIESTCDETAAAIVEDGRKVISNVISTSVKEQALYGGVVPEIASRRHAEYISATVDKALADANMTMKDVDAVAVTFAPGLIGAVLVGVNFAKGLAYAAGKPLVPVHHLRGHIAANYLTHQSLHPPFLCLVASGGHSHIVMVEDWCRYKVLGRTVDDAAGEAYDKVARTLGLPYPGGPSVAAAARDGDPHAYKLPVPHVEGKYNVSFSGLKTAVINEVHNAEQKGQPVNVADMAASFQERIDQILAKKLLSAAADTGAKQVVLAGGVAANGRLRQLVILRRQRRHDRRPRLLRVPGRQPGRLDPERPAHAGDRLSVKITKEHNLYRLCSLVYFSFLRGSHGMWRWIFCANFKDTALNFSSRGVSWLLGGSFLNVSTSK